MFIRIILLGSTNVTVILGWKELHNMSNDISKETVVLCQQAMKHLVGYQHEVDRGKLTAIVSFEKLIFQV